MSFKTFFLIPLFAVFFSFPAFSQKAVKQHTLPVNRIGEFQNEILSYVNDYRRSLEKPPLQLLPPVNLIAATHSLEMASHQVPFGHAGFDTRWDQIMKTEPGMMQMAENVAFGKLTAREVVDLWINSPGHQTNLTGNYNFTGIGIAASEDGTLYFTQIYIRK